MTYEEFLKSKQFSVNFKSVDIKRDDLNSSLFEYQKDLVYLALKKGHFALFAMTGSGKTAMQMEWAYQVWKKEKKPILILAPLAVSHQSVDEAKDILGYDVKFVTNQEEVINGINITNYEKLEHFNADEFVAIVLDESSILKSFTGKYRDMIIENFQSTPYKLACSATPAPNDHMELGNHSEFLNVMSRTEMLSMFFVHDGGETSKWRLKGHARDKFWEFVSSWSAVFTKPSDIGYSKKEDNKFKLPKKNTFEHIVYSKPTNALFANHAETLDERRQAKKDSLVDRCNVVAELVNNSDDIWLVWCERNDESALLKKLIDDCVEVKGSDKDEHKSKSMHEFAKGNIKCLITKPKIAGFGMNWQVCHNVAFASISDSFEQFFQSERRVYRYGQKHDVNTHVVTSEAEGSIKLNLARKEKDFLTMIDEIVSHTKKQTLKEIKQVEIIKTDYNPQIDMKIPTFLKEVA